jgi:S-methylmethionine-dependent homocysteine/selenocysteine methylase
MGRHAPWLALWVERGASVVGGCCGITPQHIAALAQALP